VAKAIDVLYEIPLPLENQIAIRLNPAAIG
jgi:hypothetical protein